ncbi:hypothetical protein C8J56DRAFT_934022 [Mycena floridula]|nr:hypothetical protein C8J56DRAFT_934022 [Mycena floridula]
MSNSRYAPLPNPRAEPDNEMEAAFGESDDEDATESHPLNPTPSSPPAHRRAQSQVHVPGTYDFELDYDYPPPGSPPPPSSVALPNAFGNSNGLIPSFSVQPGPKPNWFQRTIRGVLPTQLAERITGQRRPQGAVGGGLNNDGVFANVTAKPTFVRIQEGDETFIVPEDTRPEAPPSYAAAQADSVPPYWETTVHAPFNSDSVGEMIIDSLPTGSLFSFLWNLLVSISFQFVGFLLTYLLHQTHAARLGSRAGLGVTLIQYGFALRGRVDNSYAEGETSMWGDWNPKPTDNAEPEESRRSTNATMPVLSEEQASMLVADATTEWLSFFLMTVGWFILLTSLLGFWRVKRWERGILASQQQPQTTSQATQTDRPISQFDRLFGVHSIPRSEFFRQGFGFGTQDSTAATEAEDRTAIRAEQGEIEERELMLQFNPDDPNRATLVREALMNERRLQNDLRAAGLL